MYVLTVSVITIKYVSHLWSSGKQNLLSTFAENVRGISEFILR